MSEGPTCPTTGTVTDAPFYPGNTRTDCFLCSSENASSATGWMWILVCLSQSGLINSCTMAVMGDLETSYLYFTTEKSLRHNFLHWDNYY